MSEKSSGRATKLLVILVLVIIAGAAVTLALPFGYNNGYQPEQPLPFSHAQHAGQYKIDCLYCHTSVDKSRHATVPSLNVCMNCHIAVKTDSPWIQQLRSAYEKGQSIPWVKVHMLPDFVQFNHQRHVNKDVACQTCHGPVETMEKVYQYTDLSMGWCVNCHRKPEHNAPVNCSTCHY